MNEEVNEKVNGVCKMFSSSLWVVLEEDEDDDGDLKKIKYMEKAIIFAKENNMQYVTFQLYR